MLDLISICILSMYFAFPVLVVIALVTALIYLIIKNSEVKLIKNDKK